MSKLKIRDKEIEIKENEIYEHSQSGQDILSHSTVQRLAGEFNLIALKPELMIPPTADNKGLVVLLVAVKDCETEKVYWEIGEASDENTTSVSRKYKFCMAFKRGFDRATLTALELYNYHSDLEFENGGQGKISQKPASDAKKNGRGQNGEDLSPATPQQIKMYFALLQELYPDEVEEKKEAGKKWVKAKSGLPIESTKQIPKSWMSQLLNNLLALKRERVGNDKEEVI